MKLLAFDLGASSGKTYIGDFTGELLGLEVINRFNHPQICIHDELFWNSLGIYEHLKTGIEIAVQKGKNISSIGIDSFSNDFGLLDKAGRLVTQVHCYRDERINRNASKIYSMISKEKLHKLGGNQNALFGTFMQLASMCLEKQAYLLEGAGTLLFLPDLFIYFLTGKINSEYTISSVSQMMDFQQGDWSKEIIDAFAIPRRIFPEIIQPGTKVGKIIDRQGIKNGNRDIDVVAVCEHDTASAFLAAPMGEDSIIISSGTWSLVGIEASSPIINDFTYLHNIANEGGYQGHHRLLKNVMGLWIIQECQRYFKENGTEYSIESLIALAASAEQLRFMINPNDAKFFSPGNMPEKIITYCREHGQATPETPGEIIRCVFESLALHYRYVIEELEKLTNKKYSKINIVGGGSMNQILNQYTANVTKRKVIAGPNEATAIGNLLMQLIAHNEINSVEEGRQIVRTSFKLNEFEPESGALWDDQYQLYIQMIRK